MSLKQEVCFDDWFYNFYFMRKAALRGFFQIVFFIFKFFLIKNEILFKIDVMRFFRYMDNTLKNKRV